MRAAVVNTPAKIGRQGWIRCWEAAASRAPVFGQNEILTRAQKDAMSALAKQRGYGQYGIRQCPNPIYWDKDRWRLVHGKVHRIHPAGTGRQARRWPGYNAERTLNEVVLQRRHGKRQIAVLNTHWAPPAGLKVPRAWRRRQIKASKALLRQLVRKHLAAGREVWVIGDFNLVGPFSMPAGFTWLHASKIDKVGVAIPAGRRLVSGHGTTFPAPTDHRHGGVLGVARTRRKP